ncbi:hypothetical protein FNV43_RR04351 [Rhamnella rubrinervis]|uniref:Uncharacterized protein n=1 Tax=Rhamnella rubrinervis TaxID=2594499 RepID=A0A8K0HK51_9ROSA|nr:hypothetical protein FNV43_RR04351 [Rhamnella rubrinervis]
MMQNIVVPSYAFDHHPLLHLCSSNLQWRLLASSPFASESAASFVPREGDKKPPQHVLEAVLRLANLENIMGSLVQSVECVLKYLPQDAIGNQNLIQREQEHSGLSRVEMHRKIGADNDCQGAQVSQDPYSYVEKNNRKDLQANKDLQAKLVKVQDMFEVAMDKIREKSLSNASYKKNVIRRPLNKERLEISASQVLCQAPDMHSRPERAHEIWTRANPIVSGAKIGTRLLDQSLWVRPRLAITTYLKYANAKAMISSRCDEMPKIKEKRKKATDESINELGDSRP